MHEEFDGLMRLLIDEGYECILPKHHPEWWRETIAWCAKFDISIWRIVKMYESKG
jgi:hypothetical protein